MQRIVRKGGGSCLALPDGLDEAGLADLFVPGDYCNLFAEQVAKKHRGGTDDGIVHLQASVDSNDNLEREIEDCEPAIRENALQHLLPS